jgi:hypothetical protein
MDTFSKKTILKAWEWAAGRCTRCGKQLSFDDKDRETRGKWVAHSRTGRYQDSPDDCMILCWECHKATF